MKKKAPNQSKSNRQSGNALRSNEERAQRTPPGSTNKPESKVAHCELDTLLGTYESPEQQSVLLVNEKIRADLGWLYSKSIEGNKEAFLYFTRISIWTTQLIQRITDNQFALAKGVAEQQSFWPVAISASREFPHNLDDLRKRLEIGKTSPISLSITRRYKGKWFTTCRSIIEKCMLVRDIYKRLHFFVNDHAELTQYQNFLESEIKGKTLPREKLHETSQIIHQLQQTAQICKTGSVTYKNLLHDFANSLSTLLGIDAPAAFTVQKLIPSLKASLGLPQHTSETNEAWFLWVITLIMALTRGQPEKNAALQALGKSARLKSYRQKAVNHAPDEDLENIKRQKPMPKSEETNMWDTAYRLLWSAFNASISADFASSSQTPPSRPKSSAKPITTVLVLVSEYPPTTTS